MTAPQQDMDALKEKLKSDFQSARLRTHTPLADFEAVFAARPQEEGPSLLKNLRTAEHLRALRALRLTNERAPAQQRPAAAAPSLQ